MNVILHVVRTWIPGPPEAPCPVCGASRFWRFRGGPWTCTRCAPPDDPDDAFEVGVAAATPGSRDGIPLPPLTLTTDTGGRP